MKRFENIFTNFLGSKNFVCTYLQIDTKILTLNHNYQSNKKSISLIIYPIHHL